MFELKVSNHVNGCSIRVISYRWRNFRFRFFHSSSFLLADTFFWVHLISTLWENILHLKLYNKTQLKSMVYKYPYQTVARSYSNMRCLQHDIDDRHNWLFFHTFGWLLFVSTLLVLFVIPVVICLIIRDSWDWICVFHVYFTWGMKDTFALPLLVTCGVSLSAFVDSFSKVPMNACVGSCVPVLYMMLYSMTSSSSPSVTYSRFKDETSLATATSSSKIGSE